MILIKINHSLLSKSSPGSCKPSVDSRVSKQLQQTDSAGTIVI